MSSFTVNGMHRGQAEFVSSTDIGRDSRGGFHLRKGAWFVSSERDDAVPIRCTEWRKFVAEKTTQEMLALIGENVRFITAPIAFAESNEWYPLPVKSETDTTQHLL